MPDSRYLHLMNRTNRLIVIVCALLWPSCMHHCAIAADQAGCAAPDTVPDSIYTAVERAPAFRGGKTALRKFIKSHVHAPSSCQLKNTGKKVLVSVVVEKDGSLSDATVVKSVSTDLDQESLRVAHMLPDWVPGELNGEPVRTRITLAVKYRSQQKQLCHHDWD